MKQELSCVLSIHSVSLASEGMLCWRRSHSPLPLFCSCGLAFFKYMICYTTGLISWFNLITLLWMDFFFSNTLFSLHARPCNLADCNLICLTNKARHIWGQCGRWSLGNLSFVCFDVILFLADWFSCWILFSFSNVI